MKTIDKLLLQTLSEWGKAGRGAALATIVASRGSTPRKTGASMIVDAAGRIWGSIGGGYGEAVVIRTAIAAIRTGTGGLCRIAYDGETAAAQGMICGGSMEVYIDVAAGCDTSTDRNRAMDEAEFKVAPAISTVVEQT